jgi:hypothetical protein
MKNFMKKYRSELIGVAIGAIAGWCYWYFVGCSSGSCAITTSLVNSSLYGAFTGGILGSMFKKSNKQETKKSA